MLSHVPSIFRPAEDALSSEQKDQIQLHRLLTLVGAALYLVFGLLHAILHPDLVDPIWGRFGIALVLTAFAGLSYLIRPLRRHYVGTLWILLYLVMGWTAGLAAWNDFAGEYAGGLLVLFVVLTAVIGLGAQSIRPVLWFEGYGLLVTATALLISPVPTARGVFVLVSMALIALAEAITVQLHFSMQTRLRHRKRQLKGLVDSLPGVAFQFFARPDGTYGNHFVSEQSQTILGLASDPSTFFERFEERIPDSHRLLFRDSVDEAVRKQKPWQVEMPFVKPSGERIWLRGISNPERREGKLLYNGVVLDITARKKAEQKIQERTRALRTLSEGKQALLMADSEDELLLEICRLCVDGGYKMAWIGYAEHDEENSVRPVGQAGFERDYLNTIHVSWAEEKEEGQGPSGTAIRTREPVIVQNIQEDPSYEPWREEAKERGFASSAAIPLVTNDNVLGALNVYAEEPNAFDDEECALLHELGLDVAYGIETLRTRQRAETERRKFQKLADNLPELIYRADPGTLEWTYVNRAVEDIFGYTTSEWLENPALRKRTIHPDDRDRIRSTFEEIRNHRTSRILAYKIITKSGDVRWVEDRIFWDREEDNRDAVMNGIVRDVTDEHHHVQQLRRARRETSQMLARAAEYRDIETGAHIQRVGEISALLAEELGLPAEWQRRIRDAAPLHDVGKIGIPDEILLKEGSLTDAEYDQMKEHTKIGANLLASGESELIEMAEQIARSHHERWDGHGYPHGLSKDDIPLAARIVAVVDAFDAITHDRPYRKARPAAVAFEILEAEAGAQFDPQVVEAAFQCREEIDDFL